MAWNSNNRRSSTELAEELLDEGLPTLREDQRKKVTKRISAQLSKVAGNTASIHHPGKTVLCAAEEDMTGRPDHRFSHMFWPEDVSALKVSMHTYMEKQEAKWVGEQASEARVTQRRIDYEREKVEADRAFSEGAVGAALAEMSLHDVIDMLMEESWRLSALYDEDRAALANDSMVANGGTKQEGAVCRVGAAAGKDIAWANLTPGPDGASVDELDVEESRAGRPEVPCVSPDGERQGHPRRYADEPTEPEEATTFPALSRSELLGIYLEEVSPQVLGITSRPEGDGSGDSSGEPPEPTETEEFPNAGTQRLGNLTPGQVRELMSDRARETFSRWREATDSVEAAAPGEAHLVSDDELQERAYRLKVDSLFTLFYSPLKEQLLRHDMEEKKRLTYLLNDLSSVNPKQLAKEYRADGEAQEAVATWNEKVASIIRDLDQVEESLSTPSRYRDPNPTTELPTSMKRAIRKVAREELDHELLKRMLSARESR